MVSSIVKDSSIWPADVTLTGATILSRVNLGVMVMKGFATFPKSSELEPHDQIIHCHFIPLHYGHLQKIKKMVIYIYIYLCACVCVEREKER